MSEFERRDSIFCYLTNAIDLSYKTRNNGNHKGKIE